MNPLHMGSTLDSLFDETGERAVVEALAAQKAQAVRLERLERIEAAMDTLKAERKAILLYCSHKDAAGRWLTRAVRALCPVCRAVVTQR